MWGLVLYILMKVQQVSCKNKKNIILIYWKCIFHLVASTGAKVIKEKKTVMKVENAVHL